METIYQCEDCLRYFVPDVAADCFVLIEPQPALLGLLDMCVCGARDCRAVAQELAAAERRRVAAESKPVADFWRRKRLKVQSPKSKVQSPRQECRRPSTLNSQLSTDPSQCHRGMPPEREMEGSQLRVESAESVGSSQREFHAAVDVSESINVLRDYFIRHYGQWIPMVTLAEVSGCHAVHSRIPELREQMPVDQDIDQENRIYAPTGKAHSHYRMCLKSESVRLKRKAERDERQGEFSTTNGHQ